MRKRVPLGASFVHSSTGILQPSLECVKDSALFIACYSRGCRFVSRELPLHKETTYHARSINFDLVRLVGWLSSLW